MLLNILIFLGSLAIVGLLIWFLIKQYDSEAYGTLCYQVPPWGFPKDFDCSSLDPNVGQKCCLPNLKDGAQFGFMNRQFYSNGACETQPPMTTYTYHAKKPQGFALPSGVNVQGYFDNREVDYGQIYCVVKNDSSQTGFDLYQTSLASWGMPITKYGNFKLYKGSPDKGVIQTFVSTTPPDQGDQILALHCPWS